MSLVHSRTEAVMPRTLCFFVAASLSCARATAPSTLPGTRPTSVGATDARASTSGPVVDVIVEHLPDGNAWRVTYFLPEPVQGLRFLVPERASRVAHWRFLDPQGLQLLEAVTKNDGKGERLVRADHEPFRRIVAEITADMEMPEKAYTPSIRFADSGILFFTGQLNVVPCIDSPACERTSAVQTRFEFVARDGELVVVSGGGPSVSERWAGPDQGTYVYFGTLAPIETPNVRAVIDLGLPKWLKASIDDLLPRVFAYYAKRTGSAVNTRPLVFISYGDESRPGRRSIGGGALPGIILFEFRLGARFRNENDPALADDIAHVVAHEAAHWWNSRMFVNDADDHGGAWLHEGGADAFADRALRDLGVYSREMYHGKLSEALSLCALGLRGVPLTDSARRGRTRNWYSCGSAIALWTEAAISEGEPREDLFAFWKRLFDAAAARHYEDALYYRVLTARAPEVAAQIRRFVEQPVADPAQTLIAALTAHGVTVVQDESAATPKYAELLAVRVAEMVAEGDRCDGVYAQSQGRSVVLVEAERCQTLPRKAAIATIGGHALGTDAAQAWNAMTGLCAGAATIDVTLSGEDHPRTVPCPQSVPRPARYLRVTRTPFD